MAREAGGLQRGVSRRDLFKTAGAGAAAAVTGAPTAPGAAMAQTSPAAAPQIEALETLTAAEADILEAICARLIPSDADLDVIKIEAGSLLTPRDFAPDELRNNFRGWPQAPQKANMEIPTHRPDAQAPYSPRFPIHQMMNGIRGTSAQSVGLPGGERNDAALRRVAHSQGNDG
jgi:hypothetical protein